MENDKQKKCLLDLALESVQQIAFYVAVITIMAIAFGAVR